MPTTPPAGPDTIALEPINLNINCYVFSISKL